jgi:hypothetical protein
MAIKIEYVNSFNELASTVVDHGFTVTPTKGKKPVVKKWNNPKPTVGEWLAKVLKANRYAGHNLGIVCGRVVGIDLDADNPNKAAQLEALAAEHLGPTPFQRVGRAPRTLLLYRPAAGEIIPSIKIADCIDVLSGGKQFVAFGIHPDTGQPYKWIADCPATMRLDDVPIITAAQVKAFADAVSKAAGGSQAPISLRAMDAALKSRHSARQGEMLGTYDARIKTDANGRVVDGRDAFMAKLMAAEYAKGTHASPEELSRRVWARFGEGADLARCKGSNPKRRWELKDALSKARSICRRKPDLKPPRRSRRGHPASYLHAWRKPGYWTQAERERLMIETGRRITTTTVLAVSRVMLDAVDMATGFCTLPMADIAKQASCSTKSVTKARAVLRKSGLWLAGPGGVFVPRALNNDQVVERKGRKSLGGNIKVPPLYHLSVVPSPSPSLPLGAIASTPYQPDMLGAPVVDLDQYRQYRRGILPPDVVTLVRAEIRARAVTQDELAAELGISQPQLANALAGRFGLSPGPASRLLVWLRKAA